jgi:hypothetical protein
MHPFPLSRYQPWNINNQEQVFDVKGIKVDVSSNVRNIVEKCTVGIAKFGKCLIIHM